jgi:hypothetical protein
MNFKHAHLALAVGLAIYAVGSVLTSGDPNGVEAIVITVSCLGSMLGVLEYLAQRDRKLGRPLPPHPFRRSGSDGGDPE